MDGGEHSPIACQPANLFLLVWTIFIKRTSRNRAGADLLLVKIQTVIAESLDHVPRSDSAGINTLKKFYPAFWYGRQPLGAFAVDELAGDIT